MQIYQPQMQPQQYIAAPQAAPQYAPNYNPVGYGPRNLAADGQQVAYQPPARPVPQAPLRNRRQNSNDYGVSTRVSLSISLL